MTAVKGTLLGLRYSPYTEAARWALDHRVVAYRFESYIPVVGEPLLRARIGRWRGLVTVPVWFGDEGTLTDSTDIARHAERIGQGTSLRVDEAATWIERAQVGTAAARALGLPHAAQSAGVAVEVTPRWLRGVPGSKAVGAWGLRRTVRKYSIDTERVAQAAVELEAVLKALASALTGQGYLLGTFSYADIAMCQVLNLTLPPERAGTLRMGPFSRAAYTREDLVKAHPSLFAWRDRLHAEHRPASTATA